jgi:hypothetical protein
MKTVRRAMLTLLFALFAAMGSSTCSAQSATPPAAEDSGGWHRGDLARQFCLHGEGKRLP